MRYECDKVLAMKLKCGLLVYRVAKKNHQNLTNEPAVALYCNSAAEKIKLESDVRYLQ